MTFIIGAGGPGDREAIKLMTRTRREILNEQRKRRSPESMQAALATVVRKRFDETQVECRALDSVYNCVGLVFANRRTCVDPEHVEVMLQDDGYERRSTIHQSAIGDIAVYREKCEITHVGLVAEVRIDLGGGPTRLRVLSQWGLDGEYLHDADAVPSQYGRLAEVWTYRYGAPR